MNVETFRGKARAFFKVCETRIAGIGAEQYYDPVTDTQQFEGMSPEALIEYAREELYDLANYALMTTLRLDDLEGRLTRAVTLQARIAAWGRETFPRDSGSNAITAVMAHLGDEVDELREDVEAFAFPRDGEPDHYRETDRARVRKEAADVGILLMQVAELAGFDLLEAIEAKHAINQRRTWGEPDERGVVRHIPQPDEEATA